MINKRVGYLIIRKSENKSTEQNIHFFNKVAVSGKDDSNSSLHAFDNMRIQSLSNALHEIIQYQPNHIH